MRYVSEVIVCINSLIYLILEVLEMRLQGFSVFMKNQVSGVYPASASVPMTDSITQKYLYINAWSYKTLYKIPLIKNNVKSNNTKWTCSHRQRCWSCPSDFFVHLTPHDPIHALEGTTYSRKSSTQSVMLIAGRGHTLLSSIYMNGRSCNTLALLCECVILKEPDISQTLRNT